MRETVKTRTQGGYGVLPAGGLMFLAALLFITVAVAGTLAAVVYVGLK